MNEVVYRPEAAVVERMLKGDFSLFRREILLKKSYTVVDLNFLKDRCNYEGQGKSAKEEAPFKESFWKNLGEVLAETVVDSVTLIGNNLTWKTAALFLENLEKTQVDTIHLGNNELSGTRKSDEKELARFLQALKGKAKKVNTLYLDENLLRHCLPTLAHGLVGTSIEKLSMRGCALLGNEITTLIENLANSSLYILDIGNNCLGFLESEALNISGLRNTQIRTLVLDQNGLEAQGALAVVQQLKGTKVTSLELGNNKIIWPFQARLPSRLQQLLRLIKAFLGHKMTYTPLETLCEHIKQTQLEDLKLISELADRTGVKIGWENQIDEECLAAISAFMVNHCRRVKAAKLAAFLATESRPPEKENVGKEGEPVVPAQRTRRVRKQVTEQFPSQLVTFSHSSRVYPSS